MSLDDIFGSYLNRRGQWTDIIKCVVENRLSSVCEM